MSDQKPFLPLTLVDWLEVCAKVLLIAGAIVGAAWAYFEYLQKEEQQRIEGSLGYVKRFSEGSMLESTNRIDSTWYAYREQLLRLQHSSSEAAYLQRYYQLVMSVVERTPIPARDGVPARGIVGDVNAVESFFSELQICVNSGLCDGKAAHAYFDSYAQRFYCLHEPYLSWKAANYYPGYGKDLAQFAARDPLACRKNAGVQPPRQ